MLRRVAKVLAASVHVDIRGKAQRPAAVVADVPKRGDLPKFEMDFLRREKVNRMRNFRIAEALYNEAVTLGIIPLKNPLEGIEVDLRIARAVNRV